MKPYDQESEDDLRFVPVIHHEELAPGFRLVGGQLLYSAAWIQTPDEWAISEQAPTAQEVMDRDF